MPSFKYVIELSKQNVITKNRKSRKSMVTDGGKQFRIESRQHYGGAACFRIYSHHGGDAY